MFQTLPPDDACKVGLIIANEGESVNVGISADTTPGSAQSCKLSCFRISKKNNPKSVSASGLQFVSICRNQAMRQIPAFCFLRPDLGRLISNALP
jgi:hypothetical protein